MSDRLTSCGTSCQTTTREGGPGALEVLVRPAPGCGGCRAAWTGVVSVRHGMLRRPKEGS